MPSLRRPGGRECKRIENYLGFPTGISGQALAGRAFVQAQKFGAEMVIPGRAASLDCTRAWREGELALKLADGRTLRSRTVVVANGARYRRPTVPGLADFEGRGNWYWASPRWKQSCAGARKSQSSAAAISAGQAAVFLADHASNVHVLIRGKVWRQRCRAT